MNTGLIDITQLHAIRNRVFGEYDLNTIIRYAQDLYETSSRGRSLDGITHKSSDFPTHLFFKCLEFLTTWSLNYKWWIKLWMSSIPIVHDHTYGAHSTFLSLRIISDPSHRT